MHLAQHIKFVFPKKILNLSGIQEKYERKASILLETGLSFKTTTKISNNFAFFRIGAHKRTVLIYKWSLSPVVFLSGLELVD